MNGPPHRPVNVASVRADHGDHVPVAMPGQLESLGQAVGVGQRRGRVAGLDPVVLALGARGISRQAVLLAQRVELRGTAGEHLVDVGLVAGVEDDRVVRRVEDAVQGQSQLDDTEIGPQMATRGGNLVDQELANFCGQFRQLRL